MEIKFINVNYKIDNYNLFENLNISFKDSTITGIIGPVGCGKSSLLELVANIRDVKSGKIMIGDIVLNSRTKKKDISALQKDVGILFQSPYDQVYNLTVKKETNSK